MSKLKSLGFIVLKYIVLTFCWHSIEASAALQRLLLVAGAKLTRLATVMYRGLWNLDHVSFFSEATLIEIGLYQATVITKDNKPDEAYVGLSENTFQTRFVNHKTSFNNHSKRMSIELSKHVWNLKDSNINFRITSKILKQDIAFNPSSKRCNLCLWEKYFTICKPHLATLNELVSSCRPASKLLLKKIQFCCYIIDPIETALYP